MKELIERKLEIAKAASLVARTYEEDCYLMGVKGILMEILEELK